MSGENDGACSCRCILDYLVGRVEALLLVCSAELVGQSILAYASDVGSRVIRKNILRYEGKAASDLQLFNSRKVSAPEHHEQHSGQHRQRRRRACSSSRGRCSCQRSSGLTTAHFASEAILTFPFVCPQRGQRRSPSSRTSRGALLH